MLVRNKREQTSETHNNMDETQKHYAKRKSQKTTL